MRNTLLAIGLAVLVACEGDTKKLERLKQDESDARLWVGVQQHKADSVKYAHFPALSDTATTLEDSLAISFDSVPKDTAWLARMDSVSAARTKLELAQRAINKFMR